MTYRIHRTIGGKWYVWTDMQRSSTRWNRVSPFQRTLDDLVRYRMDIAWDHRPTANEMRDFIRAQYKQGILPLKGPALQDADIPDWLVETKDHS